MDIKTIIENVSSEIEVKKSKFIANIIKVENEEDAKEKLTELKKKYRDARHNCFSYRVMQIEGDNAKLVERFSDDGEPSGTAGAPMLDLLRGNELTNVLVVVTRYFGGILLGTGGLVKAYTDATKEAIAKIKVQDKILGCKYKVVINYDGLKDVKYLCEKNNIRINNIEYLEDITLYLESEKDKKEYIKDKIKTCEILEDTCFIEKII